ncbi:MAG TPA: hypothetical protein VK306_14610 [Acidimicrobiales bacterium]|nr:hypothetical protein [Acidimicrobiales bacterium]
MAVIGAAGACAPPPDPVPAARVVDLKVLVVSTGPRAADAGLELMARTMDQYGVPYDVMDSSAVELTEATLRDGDRGRYNGVILTSADLYTPSGSGFTLEEWQRLHTYERDFGVRESVVSGFPATDPALDLDYGMGAVGALDTSTGHWVAPAGTGRLFSYVNTTNTLAIPEYSVWGTARGAGGPSPAVTPLLVDDGDPSHVLVSQLTYADGREVLLSTIGNSWYRLHSNVLAYQFLDFATKGLFIGGRTVSLATHADDLFLADDLWDPATHTTDIDQQYRIGSEDVENLVAAQQAMRTEHPLLGDWKVIHAYNGVGAGAPGNPSAGPDPLTDSIVAHKDEFGWINHTYRALQMDRLCPDPDEPQPAECPRTDYQTAYDDIARNRTVWTNLALPDYEPGLTYLLSDSHAGLHDRNGTEEDASDDTPYPEGRNTDFLQAAYDLGVRYIASDSSRPNQDLEQRVPGFTDLYLLPRYPTNVYVNATTPDVNTDEYNWIYHDRYVAQGQDPCTIPGAICTTKSYEQVLEYEADTTVTHMLSGKAWPHYFHQTNLRDYGSGRTLLIDWVDAVMTRYDALFTLPVKTPLAYELGPDARDRIVTAEQHVRGSVDLGTGEVTLVADGPARPRVTGLAGGEVYGGQSQRKVDVGATPTTFAAEDQVTAVLSPPTTTTTTTAPAPAATDDPTSTTTPTTTGDAPSGPTTTVVDTTTSTTTGAPPDTTVTTVAAEEPTTTVAGP